MPPSSASTLDGNEAVARVAYKLNEVQDYFRLENRFRMLGQSHPENASALFKQAQDDADTRWALYQYLAARPPTRAVETPAETKP